MFFFLLPRSGSVLFFTLDIPPGKITGFPPGRLQLFNSSLRCVSFFFFLMSIHCSFSRRLPSQPVADQVTGWWVPCMNRRWHRCLMLAPDLASPGKQKLWSKNAKGATSSNFTSSWPSSSAGFLLQLTDTRLLQPSRLRPRSAVAWFPKKATIHEHSMSPGGLFCLQKAFNSRTRPTGSTSDGGRALTFWTSTSSAMLARAWSYRFSRPDRLPWVWPGRLLLPTTSLRKEARSPNFVPNQIRGRRSRKSHRFCRAPSRTSRKIGFKLGQAAFDYFWLSHNHRSKSSKSVDLLTRRANSFCMVVAPRMTTLAHSLTPTHATSFVPPRCTRCQEARSTWSPFCFDVTLTSLRDCSSTTRARAHARCVRKWREQRWDSSLARRAMSSSFGASFMKSSSTCNMIKRVEFASFIPTPRPELSGSIYIKQ